MHAIRILSLKVLLHSSDKFKNRLRYYRSLKLNNACFRLITLKQKSKETFSVFVT